jgi:hypothetical protein
VAAADGGEGGGMGREGRWCECDPNWPKVLILYSFHEADRNPKKQIIGLNLDELLGWLGPQLN